MRPDKGIKSEWRMMKLKLEQIGVGPDALKRKSTKERAAGVLKKLRQLPKQSKVALITIRWGNMGLYKDEPVIYMIRNPLYAYVSFSGGGWLKQNIEHLRFTGTLDPNCRKWIDAWLGDRWLWKSGAEVALSAYEDGVGTIVRYNKFKTDWPKTGMPAIHHGFKSHDTLGFISRRKGKHISCSIVIRQVFICYKSRE